MVFQAGNGHKEQTLLGTQTAPNEPVEGEKVPGGTTNRFS